MEVVKADGLFVPPPVALTSYSLVDWDLFDRESCVWRDFFDVRDLPVLGLEIYLKPPVRLSDIEMALKTASEIFVVWFLEVLLPNYF